MIAPLNDNELRSARQFIETNALLGVDFVPVAAHAPGIAPGLAPGPAAGVTQDATGGVPDAASAPAPARAAAGGSKVERLAELRERYEREAEIPRRIPGWTNIVFSDGSPDSELMFIGEAPGADEDASGTPFVGKAGQKLTEMINAMGFSRETVYIANILKVRPPDNRTPTKEEALLDGPYLLEQIEIVRPRCIVTLGRPASQFILESEETMGQMRGVFRDFNGIPVMPTYHPAYLLRAYTPENRKKVWSDLQQVIGLLKV